MKTLQKTPEEKTLQDCKDEVAKTVVKHMDGSYEYYYKDWADMQWSFGSNDNQAIFPYCDQAAELYAKTVSEQRDKEIERLRESLDYARGALQGVLSGVAGVELVKGSIKRIDNILKLNN